MASHRGRVCLFTLPSCRRPTQLPYLRSPKTTTAFLAIPSLILVHNPIITDCICVSADLDLASSDASNESPRPLSKVRTSFVAIEKDGRIGLQRQASGDSSFSGRKLSGDTEVASSILQDSSRTNVSSPDTSRSDLRPASGPGLTSLGPSSVEAVGQSAPLAGRLPTKALASATLSDAPTTGISIPGAGSGGPPSVSLKEGLAASPQITQAPKPPQVETPSGGRGSANKGGKESEARPVRGQNETQVEGGKDAINGRVVKNSGSSQVSSGTAQVTAALNGADKAKVSKPTTTAATSSALSSKTKPAGKANNSVPKPSATPPPTGKPATEKKKTPSTVSPGFVKPRPKSPTRPIELPSRLTQPTAAAAAKNRNAPPPTTHRPASRTATSSKGLGRSSSVASRQRPSFGPPPKQPAKDYPVPKKEAKVDESFLARMTRPTQSSANKVAEKVVLPTTPPRNRAASTTKKSTSAKSGPSKRIASRTVSAANSAAATPESKKDAVQARTVIRKVEQTPISRETISIAKRPSGTMSSKSSVDAASASAETEKVPEDSMTTESNADASETQDAVVDIDTKDGLEEVAKPVEQDVVSNASENKENVPSQTQNGSSIQESSESAKQSEVTLKSPSKPSDAMFEAFMNPGSQNTESIKANGTHENGDVSAGAAESKAVTTASTDDASSASKSALDEQETW